MRSDRSTPGLGIARSFRHGTDGPNRRKAPSCETTNDNQQDSGRKQSGWVVTKGGDTSGESQDSGTDDTLDDVEDGRGDGSSAARKSDDGVARRKNRRNL